MKPFKILSYPNFANGQGDLGSIPGRVVPKTQKMVFDASLCNTQHYKVWIKGKVRQYRERSSAPLHFGVGAIEKGAFGSPSSTVANSLTYCHNVYISTQPLHHEQESDTRSSFFEQNTTGWNSEFSFF